MEDSHDSSSEGELSEGHEDEEEILERPDLHEHIQKRSIFTN